MSGSPAKLSAKQRGKRPEQASSHPASDTASSSRKKASTSKDSAESISSKEAAETMTTTKEKKPEKSKLRRIHVSGLPAGITEQDASSRFSSFGKVIKVDGLGKLDANGEPLRYAFLDLNITKSKLQQCMNLLSGSVWKGSTLRIAEAKPKFLDQLEKERKAAERERLRLLEGEGASPADKEKKKKSKKKLKGVEGVESADLPLIDATNAKSREGWKIDPSTSTPIFPIVARPDHPLPPLPAASASSATKSKDKKKESKDGSDAKADKKKDKKRKRDEADAQQKALEPPNRARRVKIDPTKWHPQHLREADLEKVVAIAPSTSPGQPVNGSRRPATDDIVSAGESEDQSPEADDSSEESSDGSMNSAGAAGNLRSSSPVATSEGTHAAIYDEAAAKEERAKQLALLQSMLGTSETSVRDVSGDVEQQSVENSDESDSEEQQTNEKTSLTDVDSEEEGDNHREVASNHNDKVDQVVESRSSVAEDAEFKHGAEHLPAQEPEEEVDGRAVGETESEPEDEESDDPPESFSDVDMEKDDENAAQNGARNRASEAVQLNSLTEMFKPQESAVGFSLGTLLEDFDLDQEAIAEEQPVTMSTDAENDVYKRTTTAARPTYSSDFGGTTYSAPGKTGGPSLADQPLFFPYPMQEDEQPGGSLYNLPAATKEALLSRSWTGLSTFKRFKRTQSLEEITAQYESVRRSLSEHVRKRHREAVKRRKRMGGRSLNPVSLLMTENDEA